MTLEISSIDTPIKKAYKAIRGTLKFFPSCEFDVDLSPVDTRLNVQVSLKPKDKMFSAKDLLAITKILEVDFKKASAISVVPGNNVFFLKFSVPVNSI